MNTAWLFVTVLGCFMTKATDAELGVDWTTPAIIGIDGSGTIEPALPEDATTLPHLNIVGATTYEITDQTPAGIFVITAGNGLLVLADGQNLDFETTESHVLEVKADDGTTTGTATITINIANVNDNPPVFTESTYSACVLDNANADATVLTVSTTDADGTTGVNVISAMTITAGNDDGYFAIAATGVITLAKDVDMDTATEYTLHVKAEDSNEGTKLTATTTVSVDVAETCGGGGGVGILAASLLTMLVGLMTSLSLL